MLSADLMVTTYITIPECRSFADNQIDDVLIDLASNLLNLRSRLAVCKATSSIRASRAAIPAWWSMFR